MVEKNIGDMVVESLHEIRKLVREEIKSRYKNVNPLRARKVAKPKYEPPSEVDYYGG